MALYLAMLPFEAHTEFSQMVLEMDAGELLEPVGELERTRGRRVPEHFNTYLCREGDGLTHYGNTQYTPYGEPLMYVSAADLLTLADHPAVRDSYGAPAAWAYLRELPAGWNVALYWH